MPGMRPGCSRDHRGCWEGAVIVFSPVGLEEHAVDLLEAQVMTYGDWDDTSLVVRLLGESIFQQVP
jgi:hypothetical protein